MKDYYEIFGEKPINKLCELSDDYIWSIRQLGDIYDDVPDNLKTIGISVLELHLYPEDKKEEILAFIALSLNKP